MTKEYRIRGYVGDYEEFAVSTNDKLKSMRKALHYAQQYAETGFITLMMDRKKVATVEAFETPDGEVGFITKFYGVYRGTEL